MLDAASRAAADRRVCLRCEHELRGAGGARTTRATPPSAPCRCPECGATFDPADPKSWRRGRRSGFERVVGRCGAWFALLPVPMVLLHWYGESVPATYFGSAVLAFLGLAAFGVSWTIRLAVRFEIRWRLGGPGPIASREWLWIVGPSIAGVGMLVGWSSIPLHLGLAAAHADLERLRTQAREATPALPVAAGWGQIERCRRVWLVVERRSADGGDRVVIVNEIDEWDLASSPALAERIEAALSDPTAMLRPGSRPAEGQRVLEAIRFEVAGTGFLDSGWWGWIPDGPDDLAGFDQSWRRLSGNWYEMRETW